MALLLRVALSAAPLIVLQKLLAEISSPAFETFIMGAIVVNTLFLVPRPKRMALSEAVSQFIMALCMGPLEGRHWRYERCLHVAQDEGI